MCSSRRFLEIFNQHRVNFLSSVRQRSSFTFFVCGYLVSLTLFIEEIILFPLYILNSFFEHWLYVYVWIYFYTIYPVSLAYVSIVYVSIILFNYCSYLQQFIFRQHVTSCFALVSQQFFFFGLLWIHMNFRIFFFCFCNKY